MEAQLSQRLECMEMGNLCRRALLIHPLNKVHSRFLPHSVYSEYSVVHSIRFKGRHNHGIHGIHGKRTCAYKLQFHSLRLRIRFIPAQRLFAPEFPGFVPN
jgi:hypothetical protein